MEYQQIAPRVNELLGLAAGLNLVQAQLTKQGFEMVYEGAGQQVVIRLFPQVYTEGRVIMDAINDLTIILEVQRTAPTGNEKAVAERVELPYSVWFGESFL